MKITFIVLTSLHPTVSLANFVKEIKTGSALWIKQNAVFSGFSNWQEGYGAFTCSQGEIAGLMEFINEQEQRAGTASPKNHLRRRIP